LGILSPLPYSSYYNRIWYEKKKQGRYSWGVGGWGDGEMGRWGDGEMGRWGSGEMGRVHLSFAKTLE
jgi:hypothetical protein